MFSLRSVFRWLVILAGMAVVVGTVAAGFVWGLDAVTRVRFGNPGLVFLLPAAGWVVAVIYQRYGKSAGGGNQLLMEEMHEPQAGVPRRMASLIVFGTLVTHLFGGSAGREGTALQMGGSIAAAFARSLKLEAAEVRLLLMAGMAAGFGAVFGTPVAGAVFAAEVLVVGRLRWRALVPCFFAAWVADWTCEAWGAGHTHYAVSTAGFDLGLLGSVLAAAVLFGLVAAGFVKISHALSGVFARWIPRAELRPVVGGLAVIGLMFLCGTEDFLGLGVLGNRPGALTLPAFFSATDVPWTAWLWKLVFTVVTLSAGFKGGEVTPLFFIGAALGNTLAVAMGAPVDLFAALGFIALFAAASKTPLASAVLGVELFGAGNALYFVVACLVAMLASGSRGIYPAQRRVSQN